MSVAPQQLAIAINLSSEESAQEYVWIDSSPAIVLISLPLSASICETRSYLEKDKIDPEMIGDCDVGYSAVSTFDNKVDENIQDENDIRLLCTTVHSI